MIRYGTKNVVKSYTISLIGLDLRKIVVIGGGKVASRKVEALLLAGARVIVISPVLAPELEILALSGSVETLRRTYREGDLDGAFLAIAATDDPQVNHLVWSEAVGRNCLINVVDDPQHSNFTLPAVVHRGEMSIAISTGGSSPALARRLRERIDRMLEPEYAVLTEVMAELRPELIGNFPPGADRLQAAFRVIDSDILNFIKEHGRDAAISYGRRKLYQQD
jgi:precorrin-2 dehydrogenase/sirohydrochlorin ferrochelatase